MSEIIRATGNTNNVQRLVMPQGYAGVVTAYLWGGGGAGGGSDSRRGGNGCGAMCSVKTFSVVPGDVIDVAVGAGGQWGGTGAGQGSHPGTPGTGFTTDIEIWNTRQMVGAVPNVNPATLSVWSPFLNSYAVKEAGTQSFDKTVNVTFPSTDYYTFTGTGDNTIQIYVDGVLVMSGTNWPTLYDARAPITAGVHAVRITGVNTGGPYGWAAQITVDAGFGSSFSYSGGFGGTAGPQGSSGAGGGGGGATVLFKNSSIIAVAGGGGGGGGGGNSSNPLEGQSAPGDRGRAPGTTAGQNGANKNGDGGGGGGGGGGYDGGQGGTVNGGDSGGNAGVYGGSLGDEVYTPASRTPGGANLPRYRGQGGEGGLYGRSGGNGFTVLVFNPLSYQVNVAGTWTPVQKAFVKVDGEWKESRNVFVKSNGEWNVIIGSSDDYAPAFFSVPGYYGYNPRPGEGGGGGGGGGCCVVSTAFAAQGLWNNTQKDQLIDWCERRLHNNMLGECFRRGYQVVGVKAALPLLKTSWGQTYAKWAFDNGTRMVQGKTFSWWSIPNSMAWIAAFMMVGAVVTTRYANRCWRNLYKD